MLLIAWYCSYGRVIIFIVSQKTKQVKPKTTTPHGFEPVRGVASLRSARIFMFHELTRKIPSDRPKSVGIQPHESFRPSSLRRIKEPFGIMRGNSPRRTMPKICFTSHGRRWLDRTNRIRERILFATFYICIVAFPLSISRAFIALFRKNFLEGQPPMR